MLQNFRNFGMISLVSTLMLAGCGGETRNNEMSAQLHKINLPEANIKVDRANWQGVDELTNGLAITNNEEFISFKIGVPYKESHLRASVIFIDADNNSQTGYARDWNYHIGAEYMIENNNLYSYNGSGWNWTFIARVDSDLISRFEDEYEVPRNILTTTDQIRAMYALFYDDWNLHSRSDVVSYDIKVENNNQTNVNISDTDSQITISLTNNQIVSNDINEDIFIDSDNNPNTGYTRGGFNYGAMGADYLIEGSSIYQHSSDGWHWNRVGQVTRDIEGHTMRIVVDKSRFNNLSNTIRVMPTLSDANWRIISRFDLIEATLINNNQQLSPQELITEFLKTRYNSPEVTSIRTIEEGYYLVEYDYVTSTEDYGNVVTKNTAVFEIDNLDAAELKIITSNYSDPDGNLPLPMAYGTSILEMQFDTQSHTITYTLSVDNAYDPHRYTYDYINNITHEIPLDMNDNINIIAH